MTRLKKTALYLKKSRKFGDVQPAEAGAKSAGQPSSAAQQLAEEPAVKRRPAARRSGAHERCAGHEGEVCVFSTQEPGATARVHRNQPLGQRWPLLLA